MGRIQQSKNPSNIHLSSFIHPFIPIEKHQSNRSRMASRTHNSSSETMELSPRNCPQLWELLNDSKISDLCKKQPEPKSESPWKSSKMPAAQAISQDFGDLMHFFLEEPLGFLNFGFPSWLSILRPGMPRMPQRPLLSKDLERYTMRSAPTTDFLGSIGPWRPIPISQWDII